MCALLSGLYIGGDREGRGGGRVKPAFSLQSDLGLHILPTEWIM